MTDDTDATIPNEDKKPEVFGLMQVKCDGETLYKINMGDDSKIFEVRLHDLRELRYSKRFSFTKLAWLMIWGAGAYASWHYISIIWLKWVSIVFVGLIMLSFLTELMDKKIIATTRDGTFDIDVDDSELDADVKAFIATVLSRV